MGGQECAFYSVAEVAVKFGMSQTTVRNRAREGKIPCILVGRRIIFHKGTIDRIVAGEIVGDLSELPKRPSERSGPSEADDRSSDAQ